jgi:hypothetical protein
VAELSHDTAEDGFHEIQLSGKQLVFLFMATTVVSVVIFLCGVLVGRGVQPPAPSDPLRASAAPATSTPSASAPASTPPAAQQPAQTPVEPPPAPPAEDELTYKKRLESTGAIAEDRLKSGAPKSSASPQTAVKTPTEPPPAPTESAPTSGASAQGGRPGRWVVQIVALRDRGAATSLVQRLTGKGYPAFLVNPAAGAPAQVYKVQVGRYDDRREAEQVKRRLEKEEKFKPWISP